MTSCLDLWRSKNVKFFKKNFLVEENYSSRNLKVFYWIEKHRLFLNIFLLWSAAMKFNIKLLPKRMFPSSNANVVITFQMSKNKGIFTFDWRSYCKSGQPCCYKSGQLLLEIRLVLWIWVAVITGQGNNCKSVHDTIHIKSIRLISSLYQYCLEYGCPCVAKFNHCYFWFNSIFLFNAISFFYSMQYVLPIQCNLLSFYPMKSFL